METTAEAINGNMDSISADNEWSTLRSVILPSEWHSCFRPKTPFPADIVERADTELEGLVAILQREGVQVHRPKVIDWRKVGGYTAAMPRDGLLTVGHRIIEAPFAWACRRREIELAYGDLLRELEQHCSACVVRAPTPPFPDTLYDLDLSNRPKEWAINNSRPAFDAADFMRLGKTLLGQFSNVTNMKGVQYLQANLPEGYTVEIIDTNDPHAMHIDATMLPLRHGLLVYNSERVTEAALRRHKVLHDWDLQPYPFTPATHRQPPLLMTSAWLVMNVLVLDGRKVLVEEQDVEFSRWLEGLGMVPYRAPFVTSAPLEVRFTPRRWT